MKEEKFFDIVNNVDDDLICEMLEYSPDTEKKGGECEGELYTAPEKIRKPRYWQYPVAVAAFMLVLVGALFIFNSNNTLPYEEQTSGSEQTDPSQMDPTQTDPSQTDPSEGTADIDTSMPSPFPEGADGDENSLFYMPGKTVLNDIPAEFMRLRDADEVNAWIQSFPSITEAPSELKDYANLYSFFKHFNITTEEAEAALDAYMNSDDESVSTRYIDIWSLISSEYSHTTLFFSNIFAIVIGENTYSPNWLYTHTAEGYRKAGITAEMVIAQAPLYTYLNLTDEARAAFKKKLSDYTGTDIEFVNVAQSYPLNLLHCRPVEARYCYNFEDGAVTLMDDYDLFRQYFFGTWENEQGWGSTTDKPLVIDDSMKCYNITDQFNDWCTGEFYKIGDSTLAFVAGGSGGGILHWLDMNEPETLYYAWGDDENGVWLINSATEPEFGTLKKTDAPPNEPEENFLSVFRLREISRDYGIDFSLLTDMRFGYKAENGVYYLLVHNAGASFYPVYLVSESPDKLEFRTTVGNGFEEWLNSEARYTVEKINGEWVRTECMWYDADGKPAKVTVTGEYDSRRLIDFDVSWLLEQSTSYPVGAGDFIDEKYAGFVKLYQKAYALERCLTVRQFLPVNDSQDDIFLMVYNQELGYSLPYMLTGYSDESLYSALREVFTEDMVDSLIASRTTSIYFYAGAVWLCYGIEPGGSDPSHVYSEYDFAATENTFDIIRTDYCTTEELGWETTYDPELKDQYKTEEYHIIFERTEDGWRCSRFDTV